MHGDRQPRSPDGPVSVLPLAHDAGSAAHPPEQRRAICCHCATRCGVVIDLDGDGQPARIRGDEQHPVSQSFLCPRGRAAIEYHQHPNRLRHPLKRVGERGSGEWVQIGWDDALDEIAERLLRIAAESGPEAVAYLCGTFHGADANFGYRLMHQFGSPNSGGIGVICGGPRFAAESLMFGSLPGWSEYLPGITQTILLWAQHPSASNPLLWRTILRTRDAGARLIVVDARPTAEARAASLWLQPRPGTDAALALGLLNVIMAEDLIDHAFAATWITGLDALRVRCAAYPPERVAAITGVAADDIRTAARAYATAPAAAVSTGAPNGSGRTALSFELAIAAMIALTGNLDRPGGNRVPHLPLHGSKTSSEAYASLPPEQRRKRLGTDRFRLHDLGFELQAEAARRVWPQAEYPYSVQFWAAAHPPAIFRAIADGDPYQVRALLVQHNNLFGAYTNGAVVHRALTSPYLAVSVVHELFMTPTAALADYVLPAASWMERPFLWSSGRGDTVWSGQRVVAPADERHSDYELCRDLGRRLGQTWPDTVEEVWDAWLRPVGLTFAELADREQFWLPGPSERDAHLVPDPATGQPRGFGTPTGTIELAPTILEQLGYDPLPTYEEAASPDGEAYPIALMTGATRIDAHHQDHRQIRSLRSRHPDPTVEIDPKLAERLGIAEGDWVRISTPAGTLRQRARFVANLGTDRVSAERWWYPERPLGEPTLGGFWESNVNAYVGDDLDACDAAYGAWPFRLAWCNVERERAAEPAAEAVITEGVPGSRGNGTRRPGVEG